MRTASAVALAVLLAGCAQQKPAAAEKKAEPAKEYFKVDPATAVTLHGKATFKGVVPKPKRISMDAEADCEKLHKTPVFDEPVAVAKNGALANVFVYIKTGLEGKNFAPATQAVMLDQHGCQFVPRVIALQTGQTLNVKNSDPVSHNIHPQPKNNRDWNQQQTPGAPDLARRFGYPEVMIPVKCNIHNWMRSYIGVLAHPYFAVTPATGEFTLSNIPPGKYTLAAWHETLGEQTQDITLPGTTGVSFSFAAK